MSETNVESSNLATEMANFRESKFNHEFRTLINQCQEVIQSKLGYVIEMGGDCPELNYMKRYLELYNKMDPHEHYRYFYGLYNDHRNAILETLHDDNWLRSGTIVIQFGKGNKNIEAKCKQICILLSNIYLMACELKDQADQDIDGIDEFIAKDLADNKDLIRPDIIKLHLFRIFYYLIDEDQDKKQLGRIVSHLENILGVSTKTVGSEPWLKNRGQGDGLSGLFDMAKGLMQRFGLQVPEDIPPPSNDQINEAINNVFNNNTTQNALQGMLSSIQGCNNFGDAMQSIMTQVSNPETMSQLQNSMNESIKPVIDKQFQQ